MTEALIGLGSNVGDRFGHLSRAVAALRELGPVRVSGIYETEPVGPPQAKFLNAVVSLDTSLSARELFTQLKRLEVFLGREPGEKWGPREIDLDLLRYGDETIDEPDLKVPHPETANRAFVLVPMSDLGGAAAADASGLRRLDRLVRALAYFGVATQALFVASVIATGLVEAHYSFVRNFISDLGSMVSLHAEPYNFLVSVSGLGAMLIAVAAGRVLPKVRRVRVGFVLMGIYGLGMFIDGLFREDCWSTVDPKCHAAVLAGRMSFHNKVHDIESIITFAAIIAAPIVFGSIFRGASRVMARLSYASSAVQIAGAAALVAGYAINSGWQGVPEIVEMGAAISWLVVVALWAAGRVRLR